MLLPIAFVAAAPTVQSLQGPQLPPPELPSEIIYAEAPAMPFAADDDGVPLPNPAVWKEGKDADELVAPASGDPFFLGFIGGKHFPPADERIDPRLDFSDALAGLDGRANGEGYAFVMFQKRMTAERVQALRDMGVRVLDFHPHYTLKVALAPQLVDSVASLDFVRWIGAPQTWQKVQPRLVEELSKRGPGERVPVYINLFESDLCEASTSRPVGSVAHGDGDTVTVNKDESALPRVWMSNGWQQRALEQLGVKINSYQDSIHAFRAELTASQLEALLALDFVQFVEREGENTFAHDESMPMVNADRMRALYSGGTNSAAIVGVIDSGCDLGHTALDQFTVGWDFTPENLGPFEDLDGHGSHVWGTVLGNNDVDDSYQGAAPGLGWAGSGRVFSAKIFNSAGSSQNANFAGALAAMHSSYNDGTNTTPRPHVVNNSYGLAANGATGTEASARTIDAEVWDYDQAYVFAAGNEGPTSSSCREQATAKNALTVGSVMDWSTDPGDLANNSSRGPTGDGRWKPNVCAPGNRIYSVMAETTSSYTHKSGTSMAAPHVTGVAAQLCDRYSFFRYNPEAIAAVLMASAITKDDTVISSPTAGVAHLNTYGAGRVDAYKATGGNSQQGMYFWSTTLGWNDSTFVEFPVNSGATRLSVVVHYIEPEASSGASQALRNNFNTWLDAAPFTANNTSGDFSAQQSSVDNTEIRILNSPTVANWRIKIAPGATIPFESVRVGICAVITYGDTTPNTTLNLTAADYYVQPNEDVDITAVYSNPSYVASAVYLDSTSSASNLIAAYGNLADGSSANWINNEQSGRDICIGNVAHNSSRTANWTVRWPTEGLKSFQVEARSDNALDETQSIGVFVDGTAPATVTNLSSSTHTAGQWTNDTTITYTWTTATDNLSGIDGYGLFTGMTAGAPSAIKDIEEVTSFNETLSQGTWWFNIRSLDNCGNWDVDHASFGPIRIDTTAPGAVGLFSSSTHTVGVQSCTTTVSTSWAAASDTGGSGVLGYVCLWSSSPVAILGTTVNNVTGTFVQNIGSSTSARYFHVRAIDTAGNAGPVSTFGPFFVNATTVSTYCTGKTNSLGCVPSIGTNGAQPTKSGGNFTVNCSNVLNQKFGLLFFGTAQLATPFQGGTLCVASPTQRTPSTNSGGNASGNSCTGNYSFTFTTAQMNAFGMDSGETFFAQWWMRDPQSASTTGLSNAVRFTVCQ